MLVHLIAALSVVAIGTPADNHPPPPVASADEGGGTVDTNLDWPGSRGSHTPSNHRGGSGDYSAPPYCRITDIGGILENQKLLDVDCGSTGVQSPRISTAVLAQEVANQLPIPKPDLEIRPFTTYSDGTRGGLTGAPMWLWIGKTWKPLSQRTTLGPIWVNVVATPTSSSWSFGDGTKISCPGRGTPLADPSQGLRGSPTCGHTYQTTSAKVRGHAYQITATVTWTITWTGSGNTGGILPPLLLTTSLPYTVKQSRSRLISPHRM